MAIANGTKPGAPESGLPPSKSPNLVLVHPTDEEKLRQLNLNGVAWRGALSLDAYLRREHHLAQQDATREGGLTSWVLADSSEGKSRRILAGCETYRKKALIALKGKLRETTAHGVGSVFCPEEFRGRGYASRMIRDLGKTLSSWQADNCLFSILFSDIGKTFYASHGWKSFPSSHISLPPQSSRFQYGSLPSPRPILAGDLPELCAQDEFLIRRSMKQTSAQSDKALVALIPDIQTIRWHHAREEFVGLELHGKIPEIKGAIIGEEVGKRVWCYWTRMWYNEDKDQRTENTLYILRLVVEEKDFVDWELCQFGEREFDRFVPPIAALLSMAQGEAARWNLEDVQIWNPNQVTVSAAQYLFPHSEVVHRDQESICSLRWYGEADTLDDIVWLGNEKYGWC